LQQSIILTPEKTGVNAGFQMHWGNFSHDTSNKSF